MYTKRNLVGLSRRMVMYGCLILALVLSSPGELRAVVEPTAGDQAPQSQTQDHVVFLPYISRKTCTYCYYVDSVNGSDSNPGTSTAKPWRTLDKVNASYASFRPGAWIHFKRGSSWTGSLKIRSLGTASNPIIFTAYGTGARPVITYPGSTNLWGGVVAVSSRANYVIVENLLIKDSRAAGLVFQGTSSHNIARNLEVTNTGYGIISGGQYNVVTGNYIHDLQLLDIGYANGAVGIGVFGSNSEFSYNRLVNCIAPANVMGGYEGGGFELYGQLDNNYIHHNRVENAGGFMEIGGGYANNTTVAYNVFYNHKWFFYLNQTGTYGSSVSNFRIENNTIVAVNPVWLWALFHFSGDSDLAPYGSAFTVRNNVVYLDANNQATYVHVSDATNIIHDHNLYYYLGTRTHLGFSLGTGESVADPRFVNLAGRNLHLQSGSPAINKGVGLGYTLDLDGRAVPVGALPDLGAYEYPY